MKVLWITNIIFPYPEKKLNINKNVFGGWLISLAENLAQKTEIELEIATVYSGKKITEMKDEKTGIKYYLIPGAPALKYSKNMEKYWKKVYDYSKPDLVHIHGTEFAHGLAFTNACPNAKIVTSIQGLVSTFPKIYYSNISMVEIIKNITIRDILKFDNIIQQKKKFEKRGINEIKLIKKSNAIIGRTTWDYANTKAINPNETYYKVNESLRTAFYNNTWDINKIEKHSIFTSQGSNPMKGLHFLLESIKILKEKYTDIKLYIAGFDITNRGVLTSGYGKYIRKLIKKYNIEDNIIFMGLLDEEKIAERMLKSNVFVLPSVMENSSNSLGEAMLLGVPCVATNTGGTMDMLEHGKEGFLYPYTEPAVLAEYITQLFENNELCKEFGIKSRECALNRHNKENNVNEIIKVYKEMLK